MSASLRHALFAVVALAGLAAPAAAVEKKTYTPVPATVGKALKPSPELLATAAELRKAAAAGDRDAVWALIADEVGFVGTGITATVGRRVEKIAFDGADAALEKIGLAFTEGEPIAAAGKPIDFQKSRIATALTQIGEALATPDWASDPMVPGGWCTRPGAKWDPKAAEKAGLDDRALFLIAAAEARAEPKAGAKALGKLAAGRLYRASGEDRDGWTPVVLPDGSAAWLPPGAAKAAQGWGFCFLPNVAGGWLLSTVVSALN